MGFRLSIVAYFALITATKATNLALGSNPAMQAYHMDGHQGGSRFGPTEASRSKFRAKIPKTTASKHAQTQARQGTQACLRVPSSCVRTRLIAYEQLKRLA